MRQLLRDPVAAVILVAALLLRVGYAAEVAWFDLDLSGNPVLDMVYLHENAQRIARGDVRLEDPYWGGYDDVRAGIYGLERYDRLFGRHAFFEAPGYLYFAAACERIGGGVYATAFVQELLGTLTCAFVYAIALRLRGLAAARVALAAAAFSLEAVCEAGYYLREPLLAFLCAASVLALDRARDVMRPRAWVVVGLVLGIGWTCKVTFALLAALVPVLAWRADRRATLRACAAAGLGFLLAIAPLAARNASLGVRPFQGPAVTLHVTIARNHVLYPGAGHAARHDLERRLVEESGDTVIGGLIAAIRTHPRPLVDYPLSLARKLGYFWLAVDFWDDLRSSYLRHLSPVLAVCRVTWGSLAPFTLIGLALVLATRARRSAAMPLLATFLTLGLLVALVGGVTSRYRLVVEPLACVLFAVTVVDVATWMRHGRWAAAVPVLAVAAALFWVLGDARPPLTKQALRDYVLGTWGWPRRSSRYLLARADASNLPGP